MDVDEDVAAWVECRVSRLYWLSNMMDAIAGVRRKSAGGRVLYDFFSNHLVLLNSLRDRLLSGSFCLRYCRGLCCYFPVGYSNQLPVSQSELEYLRGIVSDAGGRLEDCVTFVPFDKVSADLRRYLSVMDGFVFDVGGTRMVCMVNPSGRVIDGGLLRQLPKHIKKFRGMWVNSESCACRFLDGDGRCMLYGKLRFTVCREFYCLTAFTAVVLQHLGLWDDSMRASMEDLNAMACDVALAFKRRGLLDLERRYDSMFRELAIEYVTGGDAGVRYRSFIEFEREYDSALRLCVKKAMQPR
jgi:hypothetical protein